MHVGAWKQLKVGDNMCRVSADTKKKSKTCENGQKCVLVTIFMHFRLFLRLHMRYRPLSTASGPLSASPSASTCFQAQPVIFN